MMKEYSADFFFWGLLEIVFSRLGSQIAAIATAKKKKKMFKRSGSLSFFLSLSLTIRCVVYVIEFSILVFLNFQQQQMYNENFEEE